MVQCQWCLVKKTGRLSVALPQERSFPNWLQLGWLRQVSNWSPRSNRVSQESRPRSNRPNNRASLDVGPTPEPYWSSCCARSSKQKKWTQTQNQKYFTSSYTLIFKSIVRVNVDEYTTRLLPMDDGHQSNNNNKTLIYSVFVNKIQKDPSPLDMQNLNPLVK